MRRKKRNTSKEKEEGKLITGKRNNERRKGKTKRKSGQKGDVGERQGERKEMVITK
jgi:hypothetical protein